MHGDVSAAVPVLYVRDLAAAREFYARFGYAEQRSGGDGEGHWSYLQSGEHTLLLAAVQPPLIQVELPLLIYVYVRDLAAVQARFEADGHPAELVGYPDHAPGGEARTVDPDGNTVMFGQRVAVPGETRRPPTDESARSSLMRQAAEAISRRGGAPATCQIGTADGGPCAEAAEVKLADPWGETVWGCLVHADEALINARSAFIATEDAYGLGPWLRQRRSARTG